MQTKPADLLWRIANRWTEGPSHACLSIFIRTDNPLKFQLFALFGRAAASFRKGEDESELRKVSENDELFSSVEFIRTTRGFSTRGDEN